MDIRKLQRAIVDGLEDVKAQNIVVFNTEHLSPLFERVIIASGTSNRQTKALAASVRDAVKARGLPGAAHRGRRQRRVDHRRLRRRRRARDAAGHPRLLPPRRDLGRQAGQDEARQRAPRLVKAEDAKPARPREEGRGRSRRGQEGAGEEAAPRQDGAGHEGRAGEEGRAGREGRPCHAHRRRQEARRRQAGAGKTAAKKAAAKKAARRRRAAAR